MRLTNIEPGDIVQVDDGRLFYALVRERQPRELRVQPISGHFNPKPVKPRNVTAHWRKAGRRKGSP